MQMLCRLIKSFQEKKDHQTSAIFQDCLFFILFKCDPETVLAIKFAKFLGEKVYVGYM